MANPILRTNPINEDSMPKNRLAGQASAVWISGAEGVEIWVSGG
jgi:hypothetical protein